MHRHLRQHSDTTRARELHFLYTAYSEHGFIHAGERGIGQ